VEKLAPEKRLDLLQSEEARIFEDEQLTKEDTEQRENEERGRSELERLEREALDRIIQEQKLRLENLEQEENLRAEKMERKRFEIADRSRTDRLSRESGMTDPVPVSSTQQETDNVFDGQNLQSPSSPTRRRLPSQDMATQTDDGGAASTVVGEVKQYPADVVTERLLSDSGSSASSPVPNADDSVAPALRRPAGGSPVRQRPRSAGYADDDGDPVSSVVVHEYGELLSFWRADPTDGRLTRARANSRRAVSVNGDREATVHEFDLPPEQWSSRHLEPTTRDSDDSAAKSETKQDHPVESVRHHDDDDGRHTTSATDERDISEKSFVNNTLSCIGQYSISCISCSAGIRLAIGLNIYGALFSTLLSYRYAAR